MSTAALPITTFSSQANMVDLAGTWRLSDASGGNACPVSVPGDVHHALFLAKLIPDPYYGLNEELVQWVGERDWLMTRTVQIDAAMLAAPSVYLNADTLDTFCSVSINGVVAIETGNRFRRYRVEVKPLLKAGLNTIELRFRSSVQEIKARAAKLAYPIPFSTAGQKIPHWNLIRKPMCHGGWDWGISIFCAGVSGDLSLRAVRSARIEHVTTVQEHAVGRVTLKVTAELHAPAAGSTTFSVTIDGKIIRVPVTLAAGTTTATASMVIHQPRLWWPNGHGEQPLYELIVTAGDETVRKQIGLRTLEVINAKDAIGRPLTIRVNGRDIFCKGANWIPTDAFPGRQEGHYENLITSAKTAHMNMLRVWGGGQFEADAFYRLCDQHGIMIWHDFMFSCALYPADEAFLGEVRAETEYQVKRLRDHVSIALWCGDNENVGALTWFEESRKNRDRYLIDWVRLDDARGQTALTCDPTRTYWPSSPCAGPGDFSDTFHNDGAGDMHYWRVWHEGCSFDAYYEVKPRFCSEFGYQSFNSLESVSGYCPPEERNITAPIMEWHQRNDGGNRRINEMFSRYFRMPVGFAATLYLSQVQQAVAIKTAVEFWRTLRPQCMGTLYWQINDIWPVASWASVEYGGKWKQLHHHARRFFQPVIACVQQRKDKARPELGEFIEAWAVSDLVTAGAVEVELAIWAFDGVKRSSESFPLDLAAGSAQRIGQWPVTRFCADDQARRESFLQVTLRGTVGGVAISHANTHFFTEYKRCPLADATITITVAGNAVTLTSDQPAFFVVASTDGIPGEFDDNSVTLLPGQPQTLTFVPRIGGTPSGLAKALAVMHLRASY